MLVPLEQLLVGRPVPAGMNWAVVGLWFLHFRNTNEPCDPPIIVEAEGDYWRICDGRHRFIAALWAGRMEIDAELDPG